MEPPRRPRRRQILSENMVEYYESKWFTMAGKLLLMARGPFSLKLDGLALLEGTPCSHPKDQVTTGGNQYGRWRKCLACGAKLSFDRFGPHNPKPTSKKSKEIPTVPKAVPKAIKNQATMLRTAASSSHENPMFRTELHNALSQHSQELMSSLTQTLTPLIQGQMMLQQQMGQVGQLLGYQAHQQLPVSPQEQVAQEAAAEDDELMNPNDQWEIFSSP